ncbi:MAG: FAD-dependent oxidoreductase [Candidatus Dormibacteria bacterium]
MTTSVSTLSVNTQPEQPRITVLADRCAGCQECVVRCPEQALTIDPSSWTVIADDDKCVGCRQCVRTCPFSAIEVTGDMTVAPRVSIELIHPVNLRWDLHEIRQGIKDWDMALAEASRCLNCPDPTCVRGCPVHNNIPRFIAALRERDLASAHEAIRPTSVLPDICSRVCDQSVQCEGSCTWSLAGGTPVAIGALERFITEQAPVPPVEHASSRGEGLKVAIVGSGPAGTAAAWDLTAAGASVTVFEKDAKPGGLMRWGIPEFTLPEKIANRPWEALCAAGVTLKCNSAITEDKVETLLNDYDAVLFAHGAGTPLRLPVDGQNLTGVWDATQFLKEGFDAVLHKGTLPLLSPKPDGEVPTVLVVGAGNTAMDVARLARRMGTRAICVDWMDRRFAPARPDELDEAAAEGVDIRFLTTLDSLEEREGKVGLAHFSRTRQDKATVLPVVVERDFSTERVDMVVMAMGYRMDSSITPLVPKKPLPKTVSGIPDRRWMASGILAAGAPPYARHQPVGMLAMGRDVVRIEAGLGVAERVWVAGDALIGPSTVVEAMAQGRKAAQAILAAHPSKQGWQLRSTATVLVTYESQGGFTERVAAQIASEIGLHVENVSCIPVDRVTLEDVVAADLVIAGTWVEGLVVTKVRPAAGMRSWIASLPKQLGEKRFAVFCTYGFSPVHALETMKSSLEERNARVCAMATFKHGRVDAGSIKKFVASMQGKTGPVARQQESIRAVRQTG